MMGKLTEDIRALSRILTKVLDERHNLQADLGSPGTDNEWYAHLVEKAQDIEEAMEKKDDTAMSKALVQLASESVCWLEHIVERGKVISHLKKDLKNVLPFVKRR